MAMPNDRRRAWVVISTLALFLALALLCFYSNFLRSLEPYRILYIGLACACILPLLFYPRLAKRSPRSSAGLAVLTASLVLYGVYTVAHFVFSFGGAWLERIFDLGELLNIVACVIFIWLGFRSSKEKPKDRGTSSD